MSIFVDPNQPTSELENDVKKDIKTGIDSGEDIHALIGDLLEKYGPGAVCSFQRNADGSNRQLWEKKEYPIEIQTKYNHFTGKLISVCKALDQPADTCSKDVVLIELAKMAKYSKKGAELLAKYNEIIDNDYNEFMSELAELSDVSSDGVQRGGSIVSLLIPFLMVLSKDVNNLTKFMNNYLEQGSEITSKLAGTLLNFMEGLGNQCVAILYEDFLVPLFPFIIQTYDMTMNNWDDIQKFVPLYFNKSIETLDSINNTINNTIQNNNLTELRDQIAKNQNEREIEQRNANAIIAKARNSMEATRQLATEVKVKVGESQTLINSLKNLTSETDNANTELINAEEKLNRLNKELAQIIQINTTDIEEKNNKKRIRDITSPVVDGNTSPVVDGNNSPVVDDRMDAGKHKKKAKQTPKKASKSKTRKHNNKASKSKKSKKSKRANAKQTKKRRHNKTKK